MSHRDIFVRTCTSLIHDRRTLVFKGPTRLPSERSSMYVWGLGARLTMAALAGSWVATASAYAASFVMKSQVRARSDVAATGSSLIGGPAKSLEAPPEVAG